MSGKIPTYYWDTCIYLAWLKQEDLNKDHLPFIERLIKDNDQGQNVIITSTITMIEVLSVGLTEKMEQTFRDWMRPQKFRARFDVDPKVSLRARMLRESVLEIEKKTTLTTPDAIHVATAILYGANAMHTFDDGRKKSGGKKGVSLLDLNGREDVGSLKICKPVVDITPELFHIAPSRNRDLDIDVPSVETGVKSA